MSLVEHERPDLPTVERLGYTVAEACQVIPCSRSHLHRAMKKGHLRFARDGAKVLISRQAIIEYLHRGDGKDAELGSGRTDTSPIDLSRTE
jgi:excisionase family DNA binding protein